MEIKGTKDGILVNLENQDWLEAKGDLVGQIDARLDFFNGAQLILDVGNNVLRAKELFVVPMSNPTIISEVSI